VASIRLQVELPAARDWSVWGEGRVKPAVLAELSNRSAVRVNRPSTLINIFLQYRPLKIKELREYATRLAINLNESSASSRWSRFTLQRTTHLYRFRSARRPSRQES
jgi:hypothetical protein